MRDMALYSRSCVFVFVLVLDLLPLRIASDYEDEDE